MIRTAFKIITAFLIIGCYLVHAAVAGVILRNSRKHRRFCVRNNSRYAAWLLELLGTGVHVRHRWLLPNDHRGQLILCNHLSYLDVLIIQSVLPAVFVTSVEVRETPLLGLLAELGGCLFVERRDRSGIPNEVSAIAEVLRDGTNVVVFPEGTSSNGERVLPFKVSMMDAASLGQTNILPLCLRYTSVDGKRFGPENRDYVAYHGDMEFLPHFRGLLSRSTVTAELTLLERVEVTPQEDRKTLAHAAHTRINQAYEQDQRPYAP